MAVTSDIMARIAKLLALAADASNEHEAALAASKAQELLHQHNLTVAQVESTTGKKAESVEEQRDSIKVKSGSGTDWRIDLANAIGQYGYCRVLTSTFYQRLTLYWIGRPTDTEAARFTYSYLERELDRLAQDYSKTRWDEAKREAKELGISFHEYESELKWRGEHPLRARRSFLEGAVVGARRAMREEWDKQNKTEVGHALIVVRGNEVKEFVAEKYPKLGTRRSGSNGIDGRAYTAGIAAGERTKARRGIGSGAAKALD